MTKAAVGGASTKSWAALHPRARAGGEFPDRVAPMARMPFHEILDAAARLFVEAPVRGLKVAGVQHSSRRVGPAQHEGVHLEEVTELAHGEDIDALGHERVDKRVAGQHIGDDAIVQRVSGGAQVAGGSRPAAACDAATPPRR